MSHSHDSFPPPSPSGPAPIVWTSPNSPTPHHPWSGPDPFAEPDPPAPPPPVTRSQVKPAEPVVEQFPPPVQRVEPPAQEHRQEQWPQQPPMKVQPQEQPPLEPAAQPLPEEPAQDDDALTIGRGRGNSIVLDDMLVSRNHVRITADDDGLVLQDLGSRNGTYVNDERVQRTSLHEGDRIGIGATTFEVRDGWLVSI